MQQKDKKMETVRARILVTVVLKGENNKLRRRHKVKIKENFSKIKYELKGPTMWG